MDDEIPVLRTERLTLRRWQESDRTPFAKMNADEEVMADLGGPLSREDSDRKYDRFAGAFESHGYGRWVVEGSIGDAAPGFIGYTGIMANGGDHPLGEHSDIGWRLRRDAWGYGIASEAARACLQDAFERVGLVEVLAYTAPDNFRSQAVMERLGLRRDGSRDFHEHYDDVGNWHGLVWVATSPN